jgi:hypothetical protein
MITNKKEVLAADFRQGWQRQPGEGGALRACGARRHRRKEVTPEPHARRTRRDGYSGQPVPAAFGREVAKYNLTPAPLPRRGGKCTR